MFYINFVRVDKFSDSTMIDDLDLCMPLMRYRANDFAQKWFNEINIQREIVQRDDKKTFKKGHVLLLSDRDVDILNVGYSSSMNKDDFVVLKNVLTPIIKKDHCVTVDLTSEQPGIDDILKFFIKEFSLVLKKSKEFN